MSAEPTPIPDEDLAATKAVVLTAAERLFAERGFQAVSVRDITAAAGVNLASVNYHFGTKDTLLFEIFRRRATELNRERARLLHVAQDAYGGRPPVRAILEALVTPSLRWLQPGGERLVSVQFLIRARSEGTPAMRDALTHDLGLLRRFSDALREARPDLAAAEVFWRLHFVMGALHGNRPLEFERLAVLSDGAAAADDVEALIRRTVDFCEAGLTT